MKNFFVLFLFLSLSGCGEMLFFNFFQFDEELDFDHEEFVFRCDRLKQEFLQENDLVKEAKTTVHVTRKFQRTVMKDCKGKVYSNKIETIKDPKVRFYLQVSGDHSELTKVEILNFNSCDEATAKLPTGNVLFAEIKGSQYGRIRINGHTSQTWANFELEKNEINKIYYRIYKNNKKVQVGYFPLMVDYKEKTLPGRRVYKDSNCN